MDTVLVMSMNVSINDRVDTDGYTKFNGLMDKKMDSHMTLAKAGDAIKFEKKIEYLSKNLF